MTPVSAHDIARELRRRIPNAGDVKVHKLLYYCQGWHLALVGAPMFTEDIEAWANGPVVEKLWRDEKHDRPIPDPLPLSEDQLRTINYVIGRYGALNGQRLIRMTHKESPWRDASDRDSWDDEIRLPALRAFFGSRAERRRAALDEIRNRGEVDEADLMSVDEFRAEFLDA